jgi:hypothetical protein
MVKTIGFGVWNLGLVSVSCGIMIKWASSSNYDNSVIISLFTKEQYLYVSHGIVAICSLSGNLSFLMDVLPLLMSYHVLPSWVLLHRPQETHIPILCLPNCNSLSNWIWGKKEKERRKTHGRKEGEIASHSVLKFQGFYLNVL